MNTLHMHNDYIVSKLNEIMDVVKQPAGNPRSELSNAIIVFIICVTIIIVACYAIRKYFDWKEAAIKAEKKQKEAEQTQKEKDRRFELQKEYQAKALDFLKCEMDSFNKIPKLIAEIDKMQKSIDEAKEKEDENSIYMMKDSFDKLYETVIGNKDFWDRLHKAYSDGKIKVETDNLSSEYLNKINDYIKELTTKTVPS